MHRFIQSTEVQKENRKKLHRFASFVMIFPNFIFCWHNVEFLKFFLYIVIDWNQNGIKIHLRSIATGMNLTYDAKRLRLLKVLKRTGINYLSEYLCDKK